MNCTRCEKSTDGQIVATVYVARDDDVTPWPHEAMRFTGVVWCADCLPDGDTDQIREDMAAITRNQEARER